MDRGQLRVRVRLPARRWSTASSSSARAPRASVPPDAGLYAFKAAGCGAAICMPIKFLQLSSEQFYLGAPLAVAEGKVFMASNDNIVNRSLVYAMGVRR